MKNLTVKIQEAYDAFVKDAALQAEKGNKSAGRGFTGRCR